jgi:hypothetical protein
MGRWVGRDGVHTCHGKGGFDERYGVKKVAGMSRLSPDASC